MNIAELIEKYDFSESTIERITYDREKRKVVLEITFCVWAQEWYDEKKHNELETMVLIFKNVFETNCENYEASIEDLIDNCRMVLNANDNVGIEFSSWVKEGMCKIKIFAEEVEVQYKKGDEWNSSGLN